MSQHPAEERMKIQRLAFAGAVYKNYISEILFNASMNGLTSCPFAFYTELNSNIFYDDSLGGVKLEEVLDYLQDNGFEVNAMRLHSTMIIINISWRKKVEELNEQAESFGDDE
jgi:hypothetical protein